MAPSLKESTDQVIKELRQAINEDRKTIVLVKTAQSRL
jgi:hypothetical protein